MTMKILAHRGAWTSPEEKNSLKALTRAFESGFGVETDLRDFKGSLQISHDPIMASGLTFSILLKKYKECDCQEPLALNIKADGLLEDIKKEIESFGISNYFIFDMSVPQLYQSRELGLNFFTRFSEIEQFPLTDYVNSCGVWFDSFEGRYDFEFFKALQQVILDHKKVGIVSPELHGRDQKDFWKGIITNKIHLCSSAYLCTDLPFEAKEYFSL